MQTGCSRTGRELAVQWDDCKPDIVVLGKALSGGTVKIHGPLSYLHLVPYAHDFPAVLLKNVLK